MTDERPAASFDDLADEFLARLRSGDSPSLESYCAEYPEFAERIREDFPTIAALEDVKIERFGGVLREPGERFGDFEILAEIGRGGMGVVYEVEQVSLGRRVALKVLPALATADRAALDRFHREAHVTANLRHAHIVPIFNTGEIAGCPYYTMPLIEGPSLDVVIRVQTCQDPKALGAVPESHRRAIETAFGTGDARVHDRGVASIGVQIASALEHAHAHGVLHRDVKPANVLLDEHGTAWVADFGLARALDRDGVTMTGEVLGTLRYMAPEAAAGRGDVRSDVYGLGLTLYELLTRTPAFEADSQSELFKVVTSGQRRPLKRLRPDTHRDLVTIVERACAHEPEHRYASASAMRDDLQCYLEDRPIRARSVTATEAAWRWCRRNRLVASLAAMTALLVLVSAIGGWVAWVHTSNALDREREARELASGNLALSMQAFDEVFTALVGSDPLGPIRKDPESGDLTYVTLPVSEKDADVVRRLLHFYDAFAKRNENAPRLALDSALARRRVGDLLQRLGKVDDAVRSYADALRKLERIGGASYDLERARIHNEIGRLTSGGESAAASGHHELALEVLERTKAQTHSIEHDLEIARSLDLLGLAVLRRGGDRRLSEPTRSDTGSRRRPPRRDSRPPRPPRPSRGDPMQDALEATLYHDKASASVRNLMMRGDDPRLVHALARSLRLRAEAIALFDRSTADRDLDEAQALLVKAVAATPGVVPYEIELAEALLARQYWQADGSQPSATATSDARRAHDIYASLLRKHSQDPRIRSGYARAAYALGTVLPAGEREAYFKAALDVQEELVIAWPAVPRYTMSLASMAMARFRLQRMDGISDSNLGLFRAHVDLVLEVVERPEQRGRPRDIARRAAEQLARAYEEHGARAEGRKIHERARRLRR